jgi:hypothetical protein
VDRAHHLADVVVCRRSLKVAVALPFHRYSRLGEPIHHAVGVIRTGLQAHILMSAAQAHRIAWAGVEDQE